MNWDAIGAIAELLGATGVVASLGYLGVQIKASRKADQQAIIQSTYRNFSEIRRSLYENADLSRIFVDGLADPASLTEHERFRLMVISESMFLNGEEFWSLAEGSAYDERKKIILEFLAYYKSTPGGLEFWNHPQSRNLSAEFRGQIEQHEESVSARFDI